MWVARRRWTHPEVHHRLPISSESDEVRRTYRGLYVCWRIMPVRHRRLESGLVGDPQVGRHASGTSAYPYQYTRNPEDYLLGLVCPLVLC